MSYVSMVVGGVEENRTVFKSKVKFTGESTGVGAKWQILVGTRSILRYLVTGNLEFFCGHFSNYSELTWSSRE